MLTRLRRKIAQRLYQPPVSSDTFSQLQMTYTNVLRFLYFQRLFERISKYEGDIVECGVGFGDSLIMLSFLAKREGQGRKVWAFDSFEGFPNAAPEDNSPRNPQKGEWKSDLPSVRQRLLKSGLDDLFVNRQATLVKGYFEDSLAMYRGKAIALLHLDVDLYQSYKTCLNTLYPLVITGGVVAFDEYVNTMQLYSFPGAQKAIDEYLGDKRDLLECDKEIGQYYLVKPEAN